jgi:hypothetical protein
MLLRCSESRHEWYGIWIRVLDMEVGLNHGFFRGMLLDGVQGFSWSWTVVS